MAIEGDFERYSSVVLMMLQQAGQVNITSEDDELIDYVNTLRESILEAYTGIVQVKTLLYVRIYSRFYQRFVGFKIGE